MDQVCCQLLHRLLRILQENIKNRMIIYKISANLPTSIEKSVCVFMYADESTQSVTNLISYNL